MKMQKRNLGTEKASIISNARLLVEASHEAACITDPDNNFIYVNSVFERLYGWTLGEVEGKTPQVLLDSQAEPGTAKRVMNSTRLNGFWQGLLKNVSHTGVKFLVNLHTRSIRDDDDQVVGMAAFASPMPTEPAVLSPGQKEIYRCLGQGMALKEIAGQLGIRLSTVSTQVHRMIKKLPGMRDLKDLQWHAIRTLAAQ